MLRERHFGLGRSRQQGLSLVEMMVGMALGLFLVAGAVTMFVTNLGNSRQLLLEARVNQDLRAAADLITRDLRRAGYWGDSLAGTIAVGSASVTTVNPYRLITPGTQMIEYAFSRDTTENNTRDTNEEFGFQRVVLSGVGVIQMKVGGTWQTVTDPQTIDVTDLTVTSSVSAVSARDACAVACCSGADVTAGTCTTRNIAVGASCPTVRVRQYLLALAANATGNTRVARTLTTRVRPRNDELAGVCPV
jgi:prepilin peptidase dependent protein B